MPLFRRVFLWCCFVVFSMGCVAGAEASWLNPAPAVKKMYADLLSRQPSEAELETHVAAIINRQKHLMDVFRGVFLCDEFKKRTADQKYDFVEAAYLGNLGRPADGEGHNHYLNLMREKGLTQQGLCDELSNSDEGRAFALRQLYFEALYRDLDEPGRQHYLDAIKDKKLKGILPTKVPVIVTGTQPTPVAKATTTVKPINGKAAADQKLRENQLAMAKKSENAELAKMDQTRGTEAWIPILNESGKQLPDTAKQLMSSFERRRFTEHYQQARDVITKAYRDILGREPDKDGFRHYLRQWALGEEHLVAIWDGMLNSEEFKKRKPDEIEVAYLRHLLRPADKGGLDNYRKELKSGKAMADIRQDLKCSNEGICAAVRRAYWEILNRDVDQGGRKTYEPRLGVDPKKKPEAYKQVCIDLLDSGEAKELRQRCAEWKQVRDSQEQLLANDGLNMVKLFEQVKGKFGEETQKAQAAFDTLKKTIPVEFASMTFVLEDALSGVDLKNMEAAVAKLVEEVKNLGPLLTGEVQKVFVELLGQPAPDFYAAYNAAQPAWEGDKEVGKLGVAAPVNPAGKKLPSGVNPPSGTTSPTLSATTGPVAVLPSVTPPPAIPALPGFETSQLPADLMKKAQELMAGIKPGPQAATQLKAALTTLIVEHPFFKKLEPQRQQLVVSSFHQILKRPPTEEEIKSWLKKLESGQVTLDSLRAELEKNPEFALVNDLLKTGKIVPFKSDEQAKAKEEDKAAGDAIKENQVRLVDLEGFNTYKFASEVVIAEAVKTDDVNGFCITGKAMLPSHGWKLPLKVFAKQHPSVYGYRAHIFGLFFDSSWKLTSFYTSLPDSLKTFLPTLEINKGAVFYSTVDAVLQADSLPAHARGDYAVLLGDTGHKGLRLAQGLNLTGHLNLGSGDACKHLGKIIGNKTDLLIQAHLATPTEKLFIRALLPAFGEGIFPKSLTPAESSVEITGKPSVAVQTSFNFNLPKNQPMAARVRFELPIAPTGTIQMVAALDGIWKNAFGIGGMSIGNLVLSGKLTVPAMSPAFGLAGDFRFGDKVVRIAASIPASPNLSSIGFRGSINALGTEDLIALVREMGMEVGTLPFPADVIGLKDVDVSVAGQEDPTLKIPQGTTCRATLCLKSDPVAVADVQVNKDVGVQIKGTAKKLDLGPISLSGDGADRKPNTADDGAIVDISLPPKLKPAGHAYFSGRASIFKVGRDLTVWLDRRGLGFADVIKIFDAFTSKVEVQGDFNPRDPKFRAKVEIQADLAGRLAKKVDDLSGGKTPNFVKKIFSNIFNLRRAGFEATLTKEILTGSGDVPRFWIEFAALGRSFNAALSLKLGEPEKVVERLAGEAAGRVVERVSQFVKEYLQALANFFKSLFGKRKGNVDDILARYREAKSETRSRDQWDSEGNRFGGYFDRW